MGQTGQSPLRALAATNSLHTSFFLRCCLTADLYRRSAALARTASAFAIAWLCISTSSACARFGPVRGTGPAATVAILYANACFDCPPKKILGTFVIEWCCSRAPLRRAVSRLLLVVAWLLGVRTPASTTDETITEAKQSRATTKHSKTKTQPTTIDVELAAKCRCPCTYSPSCLLYTSPSPRDRG